MQSGEHQVAGVGGLERELDGLQVAQLAHQHHVGVLAQAGLQGAGEALGVPAHLALVHERALALVHELDGVLEGDDVAALGLVDVVDHGGQGGGLAAARGAGDEHEALGHLAEGLEHGRQRELIEGQHLGRDLAQHRPHPLVVTEHVDAEAGHAGERIGQVGVAVLRELLAVALLERRAHELEHFLGAQGGGVGDGQHLAVDAPVRLVPGREVEVGGPFRHHPLQQLVELGRAWLRGRGGGCALLAQLLDPGAAAHDLVEEGHLDADRPHLEAGEELAHGLQHLRRGLVYEAQGEDVALERHGHDAVPLQQLHGQEVEHLVGGSDLRVVGGKLAIGDVVEAVGQARRQRLAEVGDLLEHRLEGPGGEAQREHLRSAR